MNFTASETHGQDLVLVILNHLSSLDVLPIKQCEVTAKLYALVTLYRHTSLRHLISYAVKDQKSFSQLRSIKMNSGCDITVDYFFLS